MSSQTHMIREKAKQKRVLVNNIVMGLSITFAVFGLIFLFWIVGTLLLKGVAGLNLNLFTAPVAFNGLGNAFVGQLMLVGVASLIGIPIGLLAGTYLSEYGGPNDRKSNMVRNISDIMMSTPSIVIGAFAYAILVSPLGGYSGWAGATALAIMMVPVALKTTDDMLTLVPQTLREAAIALGAPKYKVILQIVFRAAKNGLLTGIILSIARVAGETAPLLFTSASTDYYAYDMSQPIPSLTVSIYQFTQMPDDELKAAAWAGAFVLAMFVLGVNILGRFIIRQKKNK